MFGIGKELNDIFISNSNLPPDHLAIRYYDETGNRISKWNESEGWFEDGVEQNEYGEWVMSKIFHPYTPEEFKKKEIEKKAKQLEESRKPLSHNEVTTFIIKSQINSINIPDQTSLRMIEYYPTFGESVGYTVKQGYKFTHQGKLYKTVQPEITIPKDFQPSLVESTDKSLQEKILYSLISMEYTGVIYDPIPYNNDIILIKGKYYIQDGVIYLCDKDSINPQIKSLKDLVGIYVEMVK